MIRRIKAASILRSAIQLDAENLGVLRTSVERTIAAKGRCTIAVSGGPGTGKSRFARHVGGCGFFSCPPGSITIIDDLMLPGKKKLSRRDLSHTIKNDRNPLLIVFDYRAAIYVKNADVCICLTPPEKQRIENLKARSAGSHKRYGKARYRFPPFPLLPARHSVYFTCSGDSVELFRM